jgi:hypothetical protein
MLESFFGVVVQGLDHANACAGLLRSHETATFTSMQTCRMAIERRISYHIELKQPAIPACEQEAAPSRAAPLLTSGVVRESMCKNSLVNLATAICRVTCRCVKALC